MNPLNLARTTLSLAAGALMLAACGGGGNAEMTVGDPLVSGTDVPASATTSSAAALAFVKTLAATSDNGAEPIRVGDVTLATSATDEPDPSI